MLSERKNGQGRKVLFFFVLSQSQEGTWEEGGWISSSLLLFAFILFYFVPFLLLPFPARWWGRGAAKEIIIFFFPPLPSFTVHRDIFFYLGFGPMMGGEEGGIIYI